MDRDRYSFCAAVTKGFNATNRRNRPGEPERGAAQATADSWTRGRRSCLPCVLAGPERALARLPEEASHALAGRGGGSGAGIVAGHTQPTPHLRCRAAVDV